MSERTVSTIVQLSDIHLMESPHGRLPHGEGGDDGLVRALDALAARSLPIDALVLSGDLADDGSRAAYERLADYLRPLGVPILAVAGNHDDPVSLAEVLGPPGVLELEPWRIVAIDTSRPQRVDGEVDLHEVRQLLEDVGEHPTVMVLHHPPISASTNPYFQLEGAEPFLHALADHPNVRVILTGHLHLAYERTTASGVVQLGGPSTIVSIGHDGDTYEIGAGGPTGARLLHLHDDGTWAEELVPT